MQIQEMFNPALLNKYNVNGPRYTSYPTALEFNDDITPALLDNAASASTHDGLSLYVHIPFCHSLCFYCGCNKIVTRHQDKASRYLTYLEREMQRREAACARYTVHQLHLGGGTPSFLTLAQMADLMHALKKYFRFAEQAEISIEIDPRRVTEDYVTGLAALGFNRLSIGVQDVNYQVQEAINRVQSTSHIKTLVDAAHAAGFTSINLDLIYGLPHQTPDTFATTLAAVKAMSPERISLFSYAHLPARFAAQRKIKDEWLPDAETKTALMKQAMQSLTKAGYVLIGMDHFAKPDDELARAQDAGVLHRNFQGYTTQGDLDLLGLGVSSISAIGPAYGQNPKTLNEYYAAIDGNTALTVKGCQLSDDDMLRRDVIQSLMCNLSLSFADIESRFPVKVNDYFAEEISLLSEFERDGLLEIHADHIRVFEHARLLIRVICMTFDAYLKRSAHIQRYSRVI